MTDDKSKQHQDPRLTRLIERLDEMDALVAQLPPTERKIGEDAMARIRRELQPVIDALTTRH